MHKIKCVVGFLGLSAFSAAHAVEVRLAPQGPIYLNPTNDRGYGDIVLHTIGLSTGPAEQFQLQDLKIEILKAGAAILTKHISPERALGETAENTSPPGDIFLNFQLLSNGGVQAFFGRKVAPAKTATLGASQFAISIRHHFSVDFAPDQLRVTAIGKDAQGHDVEARAEQSIATYKSAFKYDAPLKGVWSMHSLPSIESHHRLNPSTEYAVDFFKDGPDGENYHGNPHDPTSWPAYGEPVLAAAAGVVVTAIGDEVQDASRWERKAGEDGAAFQRRVMTESMARYSKDFRKASAGNLVVIRHEQNGAVEYSAYGHLKTGSLKVRVGDHVTRGQKIAQVGNTGDSPVVHLHFQVNADKDVFTSKSLPVKFSNLHFAGSSHDPGRIVSAEPSNL